MSRTGAVSSVICHAVWHRTCSVHRWKGTIVTYKQPETEDQLGRMIEAMNGAEVLCSPVQRTEQGTLKFDQKEGLE